MGFWMSDCCPHPPWSHIWSSWQPGRPCEALVCCDKPKRYHDGPGHRPQRCPCNDWQRLTVKGENSGV